MPDITSLPVPEAPPVLSTPDTRIFEDSTPATAERASPTPSAGVREIYEIERVAREIEVGRFRRVALQFPDHLLVDAPRVSEALSQELQTVDSHAKVYVLADTSYGACCVDEVAAEHAEADVVVHYGRACLSPTARLPVIYCFTKQRVSVDAVAEAFVDEHPDHQTKVVLMADLPYQHCVKPLFEKLHVLGYTQVYATSIVHDDTSALPNRTVPDTTVGSSLQDWSLFHISEPAPALLLTLTSRVRSISFYPIDESTDSKTHSAIQASTNRALQRRYALLTSLATVPIFGILINTLSVRNYMEILRHVKEIIAAAGKKSYTFVVGKVNAAKVANFSEVGGWVVIGCWESSLLDAKDFWKPIITPFELELALQSDATREWTGEWTSNFQTILDSRRSALSDDVRGESDDREGEHADGDDNGMSGELDSEEESAPPEFDLRTGRYVSNTRPMRKREAPARTTKSAEGATSQAITMRGPRDIATIAEHMSPAAQFLNSSRTWQGLGSDFESQNADGAAMEVGRSGIARGYRNEDEQQDR